MCHDPSSEAVHLKGQRYEKSTRPGEVVMIIDGCQQSKGSSFTFDDLAALDKVNDCYITYPGTNPDEPDPAGPNPDADSPVGTNWSVFRRQATQATTARGTGSMVLVASVNLARCRSYSLKGGSST